MSKHRNDGPGVGEHAFWLIFFAVVGAAVAGLITQFAIQLVTGEYVSFWNALLIDFIASLIIGIFVKMLKSLRGGR